MPADYEKDPECRWIEQFVKEVAPQINAAQCGARPNGDYELWLRLRPESSAEQVLITRADYQQGQGNVWKEKINTAIEKLNS
jgi:hypothetical protein